MRHERARLFELIEARATTRKPAAYLVHRAYIKGVPFYVDERIIVPRSLIGELLMTAFAEDNALTGDPERIASVLDLCAGGGSLAILAARVFPNARIEAVDVSPDALEVAERNLKDHGLEDRIGLKRGDLFAPVKDKRFDLILANPPYVDAETIARFPPEYAAEPTIAHAGGADGLDIVRRILREAPEHLTAGGTLLCEVAAPAAGSSTSSRICRSCGSTPRTHLARCSCCTPPILARRNVRRRGRDEMIQRPIPPLRASPRARGAQFVDQGQTPAPLDVPEGPAVAGGEPLHERADLVDRADGGSRGERAVGPHDCGAGGVRRR